MSGARRRRLQGLSFHRLIPNALTLMAVSAGITGVRFAWSERWELAVAAIVFAAILDGLDGRIARLVGATSRFGAELDSLSDFISFGVAPALIIYLWALNGVGGLGWAITLLFAICCALRLARFNTGLDNEEPSPQAKKYFTGVPAPAGAGIALLPMIFSFEFGAEFLQSPWLNGINLVFGAALMVSRLPTFALKSIKVPQRFVGIVMLGLGALVAFLISTPWLTLAVIGLLYLAMIPVSVIFARREQRVFYGVDFFGAPKR